MATVPVDTQLREHEQSYAVFRRIVTFAIMHIVFTVICAALAFLGDLPLISAVLWIVGTLVMLGTYITRTTHG
jgi:energy-converting hydrogenase Eha subunit C